MIGKNVISGTWGECWLDDAKLAQTKALTAEYAIKKEAVSICGKLADDQKVTGTSGTGSIEMHHIDSVLIIEVAEKLKLGETPEFSIISALSDPDALGRERIKLTGVVFDKVPLVSWAVKKLGSMTIAFTFSDFELLEIIEPQ